MCFSVVERVTSKNPNPFCSLYKMAEEALAVQVKLAQPGLCQGSEMETHSWGSRNNLLRMNHGKRGKKKHISINDDLQVEESILWWGVEFSESRRRWGLRLAEPTTLPLTACLSFTRSLWQPHSFSPHPLLVGSCLFSSLLVVRWCRMHVPEERRTANTLGWWRPLETTSLQINTMVI